MIGPVLLFVLFVLSIFYVIQPFVNDNLAVDPASDNDDRLSSDALNKVSLLKQIREVEFEKEIGITAEEDYVRIKNELMQEAAKVIKTEPVSAQAKPKTAKLQICPSCSASVKAGDKFCGSCGTSLS